MHRYLFSVICFLGFWGHPLFVFGDWAQATYPAMAMNQHGETLLVWQQSQGRDLVVCAAIHSRGRWSSTVKLSNPTRRLSELAVDLNERGNAVVVWGYREQDLYEPQAATLINDVWSTPTPLASPSRVIRMPQVKMEEDNRAIAIWDTSPGIYAATFCKGSWNKAHQLSLTGSFPKVALGKDGIAVWEERERTYVVKESRWDDHSWSTPQVISAPGQNCRTPDLAINHQNHAIAVWTQYNATEICVGGAFYRKGTWQSPEEFTPTGVLSTAPQVAMNHFDEAMILCEGTYEHGGVAAQSAFYCHDHWSLPETISLSPGQNVSDLHVAMGGKKGEACATWIVTNQGGRRPTVHGASRRYGRWEAPAQISPHGDRAAEVQLAMNNRGHVCISWVNQTQSSVQTTFTCP